MKLFDASISSNFNPVFPPAPSCSKNTVFPPVITSAVSTLRPDWPEQKCDQYCFPSMKDDARREHVHYSEMRKICQCFASAPGMIDKWRFRLRVWSAIGNYFVSYSGYADSAELCRDRLESRTAGESWTSIARELFPSFLINLSFSHFKIRRLHPVILKRLKTILKLWPKIHQKPKKKKNVTFINDFFS